MAGSCEHGNEHTDSIKGGEFLDQLSDFRFSRTVFHAVLKRLSLHRNGIIA
jgi:hypothetical protein